MFDIFKLYNTQMFVCAMFLFHVLLHFIARYRNYFCACTGIFLHTMERQFIEQKEHNSTLHSLVVFYYSFRNFEL